MKKILLGSSKIAVDETRAPVLDPGRGRTKTGYFWAISRDDRPWGGSDPPGIVYTYAPGRGGEAGASPKLSSDGAFSLVYYVLGFTMEEQGLDPRTGGPLDLANRQAKFTNLAAMKYPSIHAALHHMFDNDLDDRFETGLDLLISGLKARIDTRS